VKGFPQTFWCPTTIFRAGPHTDHARADWDRAVVVEWPWWQMVRRRLLGLQAKAFIWALSTKDEGGAELDAAAKRKLALYARPCFDYIEGYGYEPDWISVKKRRGSDDAVEPS
jgi:hypothetical protein